MVFLTDNAWKHIIITNSDKAYYCIVLAILKIIKQANTVYAVLAECPVLWKYLVIRFFFKKKVSSFIDHSSMLLYDHSKYCFQNKRTGEFNELLEERQDAMGIIVVITQTVE